MPEYLSPGVYIEETSFRTKTIEGVSTSTAGFVGPTRSGPVSGQPELITSLADFQRIYGDLEDLNFNNLANPQVNYMAHAVRAFFEEGGRRLFVQRIFAFATGDDDLPINPYAIARIPDSATDGDGGDGDEDGDEDGDDDAIDTAFMLSARFPGVAGNLRVTFILRVEQNVYRAVTNADDEVSHLLTRITNNSLVHVRTIDPEASPVQDENITAIGSANGLMVARRNLLTGAWQLFDADPDAANATPVIDLATDAEEALQPPAGLEVRPLAVVVEVARPTVQPNVFEEPETLGEFSLVAERRNALLNTFVRNPQSRFDALTIPFAILNPTAPEGRPASIALANDLFSEAIWNSLATTTEQHTIHYTLRNGSDGNLPIAGTYTGDPDFRDVTGDPLQMPLNGLLAFESVEDISIVAAPGYTADRATDDAVLGIQNAVINHCERMRYRVAVLDTPENQTVTQALNFRNLRSSEYAAIYYPWVVTIDPRIRLGGRRLKLPPSGFMAGIYARNDIEHAVFKAPANEVVRLAIDFEVRLNQAHQDVLNPNGVNCLRYFAGRGFLVWGARTMTDDPEWKYISLRRYFAYLQRSIDRATQWAVFENNGPELWGKIRRSVEDFLYNEWIAGGLLGIKPEQSYFVRCDRSTMTQSDLDNGRLVCLVGVAPVRPAEFVIFRIGQWTADATN